MTTAYSRLVISICSLTLYMGLDLGLDTVIKAVMIFARIDETVNIQKKRANWNSMGDIVV